jgi:Zn ribbon nucleic-acid-binding protein
LYEGDDANMWMKTATSIRKVALKELGVTEGVKREAKVI